MEIVLGIKSKIFYLINTVEPGYNDIGLCNTSYITLDVLGYQLITCRQP
jgi:hypothetical protein